jgi:ketosteroid isomerase-like protein
MKQAEIEAAAKLYVKNWETGERDEMEARLGNGFTYTSPRDDHLDGAGFFERCWPAAGKIQLKVERVAAIGPKDCVVVYEAKGEKGAFRNVEILRFDGDRLLSAEVFSGLAPGASTEPPEIGIKVLLEAQEQAIRDKNTEALLIDLAENVTSFDAVPPLRNAGKTTVRDRLEQWFGSYEGPIGCETRELEIAAAGEVAFAHALQRFSGTLTDGAAVDMWVRVTWGLRKVEERWLITHEHMSDPFDPESGQAKLDLTP